MGYRRDRGHATWPWQPFHGGIPFYDRIHGAGMMSQPEDRFGILSSMMSWAEAAAKEYGILRRSGSMGKS